MPKFQFGPKIGVCAWRTNQEIQIIQSAAKLKITGVELHDDMGAGDPSRPWKLPEKAYRKQVREVVESNGMAVTGLRCSDRFVPANMDAMKLASYRLELARDLGCDLIRIDVGPAADLSMAINLQWEQTKAMVKEYLSMARDCGITLAMHNHGWLTIMDRVFLIQQLGSPENLKLQLDVTNAVTNNEDVFEVTRKAKDYLSKCFHVKDNIRRFREVDLPPETRTWDETHWGHTDHSTPLLHVPMGDGNILDWAAYVKLLKEIKWDGWLDLENLNELEKSVKYLRSIGVQ